MLGWQSDFFIDDFEILLKEQAELLNKMKEISPESPETLLTIAIMGTSENENLEPTVYYSEALFCNKEMAKARTALDRAAKWHPDHRDILIAEVKRDQALGEYEAALEKIKRILDQGYISDTEADVFSDVFSDLGYLELILPHIRNPSRKAEIYAKVGEKEAARKMEPGPVTRMIVDEDYIPEAYDVTPAYRSVGMPDGRTQAYFCRIEHLLRDTYILKKINSDKYRPFLKLLIDYFKDKDPAELLTQQEYIALIGLYVLQDDYDSAIEVMDVAMERGFLFIGSFEDISLRDFSTYPGVSQRIRQMEKSAYPLVSEFN